MNECGLFTLINSFMLRSDINKVRHSYPYYTSLQISLWDIKYFIKNIENCETIWNFERQQISKNHYHLKYNFFHVVEKGE